MVFMYHLNMFSRPLELAIIEGIVSDGRTSSKLSFFLSLSVAVSKPQVAILTRSSREMSQTVRIEFASQLGLYIFRFFIQQKHARDSVFAIVFGCFSRIKIFLGRTETGTRYEQFDTSPETIE